jgi:tetraacyldisaccharide 4'-kinase
MIRWRTPRWWYRRGRAPWPARALGPLSVVWAARTATRIARVTPTDPGAPVICVGNLTAGGSGKTPCAMEIARLLRHGGVGPVLLASGYGGRLRDATLIDDAHTASDVGDEALLLRRAAPVVVSRDRLAGARLAVAAGAEVVVMDDGHQNPALVKALSIVVVDGETRNGEWPFGDGTVIPTGPLREPLATGLARADVVVIVLPADLAAPDPDLLAMFDGKLMWIARWTADGRVPEGKTLGFAGVAKPWRVERTLRAADFDLVGFESFPDHAPISDMALRRLEAKADAAGASLVTTEKDWVRLSPEWRTRVAAWPVRIAFDDEANVSAALAGVRRP